MSRRTNALEATGVPPVAVVAYDATCPVCSLAAGSACAANPEIGIVPLADGGDANTIRVTVGERVYERSDAVLAVLFRMGLPWSILAHLGLAVPRAWRDAAYDTFARNRRRWFGTTTAHGNTSS